MYKACIAVMDAYRARLMILDRRSHATGVDEQLVEQSDLVNPARRLKASELFTDKQSAVRSGSHGYGVDDHRDAHLERLDHAFAASVAAELVRLAAANDVDRVILCASPRVLGVMRTLTAALHRPGRIVDELARNLVKLSVHELREYLALHGLLPPRDRLAAVG